MERIADAIHKISRIQSGGMTASHSSGAGFGGGFHSGGAKSPFGLSGDGAPTYLDHRRLRQNVRRAVHSDLNARSMVTRITDTVADVGIRMEAVPLIDILGISREQGRDWSENVSSLFDLWSRSKKAHRAEEMTFYQGQRFYAFSQQRDNDIFVRLFYSSDRSLMNPLQFEFIDPDQIVGDTITTSFGQHLRNKDGIERNAAGKAISYNTRVRTENGGSKNVPIPAMGRGSGRRMMLHGYSQEYAGQSRGFPPLSHALQEMSDLTDFTTSQIKKAIHQSQIWMFVEPSQDAAASNIFEGISNPPAGPLPSELFGSNPTPPENAKNVPEVISPVTHFGMENVNVSTPGSMAIMNLDRGETIKPFQNTAPADSFDKFVDSYTAYLSASGGVPVESLLMRFGQSFSASRAALILFWRICNIHRQEEVSDFCNPIYEGWLSEEIARGTISAPGWSDPVLRSAWLNAVWHGIALPNIDPVKAAKAAQINIGLGATTLDKYAMEVNGSSGKSNRMNLTEELKELPTDPFNLKEIQNG